MFVGPRPVHSFEERRLKLKRREVSDEAWPLGILTLLLQRYPSCFAVVSNAAWIMRSGAKHFGLVDCRLVCNG